MKPAWGDIIVTWVRPADEGLRRLRLCERHLEAYLERIDRFLLAGNR